MKIFQRPTQPLTTQQVDKGLNLVIRDGLASEALVVLTTGTFMVALALRLGANNLQIGIIAALPTFTNIFQLIAIWLVQKYQVRKPIALIANISARIPILVIGSLPFLFGAGTSIQVLLFLLFFHCVFSSIAGASWNSWMKDLIPESRLGSFFSNRLRLTMTLNVVMSLTLALILDHVKRKYPGLEMQAYGAFFILGGFIGLMGSWVLSRTPEPPGNILQENLVKMFSRPLRDKNFRRLILFNSTWAFALNIATPFFTVFMLKSVGLSLSWVIALTILTQLAGIASIRLWGRFADAYSNKTIIRVAAPVYIFCIVGWSFVTVPGSLTWQIIMISVINILSGASTSGINMALTNIGIKLAPKDSSIAFISIKNMSVAFISAIAPLLGGLMADYFADRFLVLNMDWTGPTKSINIHMMELNNWNFLFIIGAALAWISLATLSAVKEVGEVDKDKAVGEMRVIMRKKMRKATSRKALLDYVSLPVTLPIRIGKKLMEKHEQIQVRLFGGTDGTSSIK